MGSPLGADAQVGINGRRRRLRGGSRLLELMVNDEKVLRGELARSLWMALATPRPRF